MLLGYFIEVIYNNGERRQLSFKKFDEMKEFWKQFIEEDKKNKNISLMTAWFGKETQDNYEYENFLLNIYGEKRKVKFTIRDVRDFTGDETGE